MSKRHESNAYYIGPDGISNLSDGRPHQGITGVRNDDVFNIFTTNYSGIMKMSNGAKWIVGVWIMFLIGLYFLFWWNYKTDMTKEEADYQADLVIMNGAIINGGKK